MLRMNIDVGIGHDNRAVMQAPYRDVVDSITLPVRVLEYPCLVPSYEFEIAQGLMFIAPGRQAQIQGEFRDGPRIREIHNVLDRN